MEMKEKFLVDFAIRFIRPKMQNISSVVSALKYGHKMGINEEVIELASISLSFIENFLRSMEKLPKVGLPHWDVSSTFKWKVREKISDWQRIGLVSEKLIIEAGELVLDINSYVLYVILTDLEFLLPKKEGGKITITKTDEEKILILSPGPRDFSLSLYVRELLNSLDSQGVKISVVVG